MSTHPTSTSGAPARRRQILSDRDADGRHYTAPFRQRRRIVVSR
jgi:hypothetical protein